MVTEKLDIKENKLWLDYKSDGMEESYLKFMKYEKTYNTALLKPMVITKTKKPNLMKWINFFGIPYTETSKGLEVSIQYVIKFFFMVELMYFFKDQESLKHYSEIFDEKYINNKKGGLYSYELEFYMGYAMQGMGVNIYILPNNMHILNDGEIERLTGIFGAIGTHISISFTDIVQKFFSKEIKIKYQKMLVSDEDIKILDEIQTKNPNYKKKQIVINFNPDETLKDLNVNAQASVDKYHEIDQTMDFGKITKIKHGGVATHIELKKKISLKKGE